MNLATRIFQTFFFIFLVQIVLVLLWGTHIYLSHENLSKETVDALTKVDKSITEGILLQQRMNNPGARDLLAYRLLELNRLDSAQFVKASSVSDLRERYMLSECSNDKGIFICRKKHTSEVGVSLLPLHFGKKLEGFLLLEKSLPVSGNFSKQTLVVIGMTLLAVFALNALTLLILWWKFLRPETLKLMSVFEEQRPDPTIQVSEYHRIQAKFMDSLTRVREAEASNLQLQVELARAHLTTQVAHDIRSPLEVLKGLKDELRELPHVSRTKLQLSIERIEEIAHNLLKSLKGAGHTQEMKAEDLLILLKDLLVEKRMEFRRYPELEIIDGTGEHSYGLFARVNAVELKSVLSNLINNAVEALAGKGSICLDLWGGGGDVMISVKDNGPGIPEALRGQLFTKGFTTKPATGNGLGLFQAKLTLTAFGGTISFDSQRDAGTTFRLQLPRTNSAAEFLARLDLTFYDEVIVLDDDPGFHEIWKGKLLGTGPAITQVYSIPEMRLRFPEVPAKSLLLCDLELMDPIVDGIDLISQYSHTDHSVLVTSRAFEASVIERVNQLGVKLLPKQLVHNLPVVVGPRTEGRPVVLIDDDRLTHFNWTSYCKTIGVRCHCYSSVRDFLKDEEVRRHVPLVFVDSILGEHTRGEIASEAIHLAGFEDIFLVTGLDPGDVVKPPWIRHILGKAPEEAFDRFGMKSEILERVME